LRIGGNFGPFSGKLDFHRFSKDGVSVEAVFSHEGLINFLEHYKGLAAHSVIFLTDDLTDLTISLKQQVQSILEIF
jgi:hypothetical protein